MLIRPATFHFFKLTVILHGKFHIALSAGKPYLPKIHISEHNIISYPDSYILCYFLRGKKKSEMEFVHPAFKDSPESYSNNAIDSKDVKELIAALS